MRCSRPSDVGVPASNFLAVCEHCCSRGAVPGEDRHGESSWCSQAPPGTNADRTLTYLNPKLRPSLPPEYSGLLFRRKARLCWEIYGCPNEEKNYPHRGAVVISYLGFTEHTEKNMHLICKIMKLFLFSKLLCGYLCIQSCPPNHNIYILISVTG